MSKSCLHRGHTSFELESQMSSLRHRRRLKRNSLFGCLFFSSVRGRSSRPWPSFPSSISAMLCLLSSGSVGVSWLWRRMEMSLFIISWHLEMGVLLMNLVIAVCDVSPVQSVAMSGAKVLKVWNVGEVLVVVLSYREVIGSGSMYLGVARPSGTPLYMVSSVPFVASIEAGMALCLGDVIPRPPYLELTLMRRWEWTGMEFLLRMVLITWLLMLSNSLAVSLSHVCHEVEWQVDEDAWAYISAGKRWFKRWVVHCR